MTKSTNIVRSLTSCLQQPNTCGQVKSTVVTPPIPKAAMGGYVSTWGRQQGLSAQQVNIEITHRLTFDPQREAGQQHNIHRKQTTNGASQTRYDEI